MNVAGNVDLQVVKMLANSRSSIISANSSLPHKKLENIFNFDINSTLRRLYIYI